MVEIPVATAVAVQETAIAVPAETTIPVGIPITPAEAVVPVAARMPAAHVVWKTRDAVETETADRPDRISRISHRWMIRHFPGEMTEDARPVDVSRIPENMGNRKAPELYWQFRGLFCLKD